MDDDDDDDDDDVMIIMDYDGYLWESICHAEILSMRASGH